MSNNLGLVKAYTSAGAINPNSLVKFSADYTVVQAAAVSDHIMGVTTEVTVVSGDRCDVVLSGIADVKLGGTVTRGDRITSDASGNGVTAAPAAGTNNWVIGIAIISGVSGDIVPVLINQDVFQG